FDLWRVGYSSRVLSCAWWGLGCSGTVNALKQLLPGPTTAIIRNGKEPGERYGTGPPIFLFASKHAPLCTQCDFRFLNLFLSDPNAQNCEAAAGENSSLYTANGSPPQTETFNPQDAF